jgi:hypothetical protein
MTAADWWTLGVAIFGAATGSLALTVQWLSYRHSRSSVTAELRSAWVNDATGSAITWPLSMDFTGPPHPDYTTEMLGVEVRNRGGAATTVERVAAHLPNGVIFSNARPALGPGYPKRLDGESSNTWLIDIHALRAAAEFGKCDPRVMAVVALGSGKECRTSFHDFRGRPPSRHCRRTGRRPRCSRGTPPVSGAVCAA